MKTDTDDLGDDEFEFDDIDDDYDGYEEYDEINVSGYVELGDEEDIFGDEPRED